MNNFYLNFEDNTSSNSIILQSWTRLLDIIRKNNELKRRKREQLKKNGKRNVILLFRNEEILQNSHSSTVVNINNMKNFSLLNSVIHRVSLNVCQTQRVLFRLRVCVVCVAIKFCFYFFRIYLFLKSRMFHLWKWETRPYLAQRRK